MNKFIQIIDGLLGWLLCLLLAAMVLGCGWQIFTRFVLNDASQYTEELLRYLLIWCSMLAVPYTYGRKRHLALEFVVQKFGPKARHIDQIFVEGIVIVLAGLVMVIGGIMVTVNSAGQLSPAMNLPMPFYYVCLPVAGVLLILYCLQALFSDLKKGE